MKRFLIVAVAALAAVLFTACHKEYDKLDKYTYYTERTLVIISIDPDVISQHRNNTTAPYLDSIMWFNDKSHWIDDTTMGNPYQAGEPYEISYTAEQTFEIYRNHTMLYFPCVDGYNKDGGMYDFQFHYCPTNTEPKTQINANDITIKDARIHGIGYYGLKYAWERTDIYRISFDDIKVPYHVSHESDKSIHYTFCTDAQYSIEIDGNTILNMPCHITVISTATPK